MHAQTFPILPPPAKDNHTPHATALGRSSSIIIHQQRLAHAVGVEGAPVQAAGRHRGDHVEAGVVVEYVCERAWELQDVVDEERVVAVYV